MNLSKWLAGATLLANFGICAVGCDDAPKATKVTVTTTTTQPAATTQPMALSVATTEPAVVDALPSKSFLMINDRRVEFPRARLRVRQTQPRLMVMLFSDDPNTAIDDNYQGNSYYFELALNCNDPHQLATLMWNYHASSSDHVDSVNGLFLEGGKTHLQPVDAHVQFVPMGGRWVVTLSGDFLQFNPKDSTVAALPKFVNGAVTVELER